MICSANGEPERFAKLMLLLFKPFRHPSNLRSDAMNWTESLREFKLTAPARTLRYLDNIDAIATAAEAGKTVAKQRRADMLAGAASALNEDLAHVGLIPEDDDKDDDSSERKFEAELFAPQYDAQDRFGNGERRDALRAQILLTPPTTDVSDRLGVIRKLNHAMEQFRLFEPRAIERRDAKQQRAGHFAFRGSDETDSTVIAAGKRLKDRRLKLIESYVKSPDPNVRSQLGGPDGKTDPSRPVLVPIESRKTADIIAAEQGARLTPAQVLALQIVSDRLLMVEQSLLDRSTKVQQLRLFIGGSGGTGKSFVVRALQDMLRQWGRSNWMLTTATTGIAGFKINGRTLSSAIGLPRDAHKEDQQHSKDKHAATVLEMTLRAARLLLIDEVSMLSCQVLARTSAKIGQVLGNKLPFGGLHVVFVGDFFQLPPPCGGNVPLYDAGGAARSSGAAQIGRELWDQLTDVVILTEQMRQAADQKWAQMLERVRYGLTTDEDYKMVQARVLNPRMTGPENSKPLYVFPLDVQRTCANFQAAIQQATEQRQTILIAVAEDALAGANGKALRGRAIEFSHALKILALPENSSEKGKGTKGLPGKLPLVLGMPIYLKDNLATEFGLCNGSQGVLVRVILDPREPPIPVWEDGDIAPIQHALYYLPLALLVRFPDAKMTTPLDPTLSDDPLVVPIRPGYCSFSYRWSGTRYIKVFRKQFHVFPGYARTLHGAQSESLENMVTDINLPGNWGNAAYVLLSRPTSAKAIRLSTSFPKAALCRPPKWPLLNEQERLDRLAEKTLQPYRHKIAGLEQQFAEYRRLRAALMTEFVKTHGDEASTVDAETGKKKKRKQQATATSQAKPIGGTRSRVIATADGDEAVEMERD